MASIIDLEKARQLVVEDLTSTVEECFFEISPGEDGYEDMVIGYVLNTVSLPNPPTPLGDETYPPGAEPFVDYGDELSDAYYTILMNAQYGADAKN